MKKVLVTGATGFVGSWLTNLLLEKGHEVSVLARKETNEFGPNISVLKGDITSEDSLVNAFKNQDAVFHLAGLVGYSKAQRKKMEDINVGGTRNVISASRKSGVSRIVHMSSVVAVGASFTPHPLDETAKYNLSHLDLGYFETKRRAEELMIDAVKDGVVDATIVNPSTIYGPGDMKKGSRGIQLKVARGKFPFYPPGGVNIVSVKDVVEATYRALESGKSGERYILAGENILIRESFEIIADLARQKRPWIPLSKPIIRSLGLLGDSLEKYGKKGPINTENAWASILYHWFDSSKAQKELDLKVTPAKDAIAESILWGKENGFL